MATQVVQESSFGGLPTSVASSASDVVILAASVNNQRKGFTVYNDSTAILYLLLANAVSSATNYTVQMAAGSYYESPYQYNGIVKGIWASANGNARVTELV
jgi:hypothetical protein